MKTRLLASASLTLAAVAAQALPISAVPGLYDTGVGASNATLAPSGSIDTHYTLLSSPYGSTPTATYVSTIHPYRGAPADAQYIGPAADLLQSFAYGNYVYALNFDLTGLNAATASLSGRLLADDDVQLYLNGNFTGVAFATAYLDFHDFSVNTGFVAGLNTLEFRLQNSGGGPTGLAVSALAGTAQAVPEPGSMSLAAVGLGAAGVLSRRRRKRVSPAS